tara:strand:+ start:1719 stop:2780 length:1062 start_codon:yes stop_codon:yes gene_type:complete
MNNSETTDTSNELLDIFNTLLKTYTYSTISGKLNVANGTVKRWIELKKIPKSYTFDLMKLAEIEIDYSKFTYKEKDQFFTPKNTAKYCYNKFNEIINKYDDNETIYTYIEPSAGSGSFLDLLPKNNRIGLDIEPLSDEIIKQDFLEWFPDKFNNFVTIGNPPFGLRGNMALRFINHASEFSDYVCFILPQLFESDGKGVPRTRVKNLNLIYSEKINTIFISPDNKEIKVECIFQIWSKNHKNTDYDIKTTDTSFVKVYSLSDGGTPSTTRNKDMLYSCDIYLSSTCFGKHNMIYYNSFDELPRKKGYGIVFLKNKETSLKKFKEIDWSSVAFKSTNSAYNIRKSQIIGAFNEI